MALRLFVSAGEASGDAHAAALVRSLRKRVGDVEVRGLGGSALEAEGARLLARVEQLSMIGFAEVARRIPFFVKLLRRAEEEILAWDPHIVLPVDYPGFNLRLARRVRKAGKRVVYYIAPQVWAWKRERRPGIARAVDRLLVVFPFEEPLFREAGIPTTFVGHPLLDAVGNDDPGEVRNRLGLQPDRPVLALLPGSRDQEVAHILPRLVRGTRALGKEGVQIVVSRSGGLDNRRFVPATKEDLPVWEGRARDLAATADAAFVASGTATLETGLVGTPLAVVYRTGFVNWHLARSLVGIRTVGLVNIAAGGDRIPELLQDDLTLSRIEETARRILFDEREREEQRAYLARLVERLGGEGAAERAAEAVAQEVAAGGST